MSLLDELSKLDQVGPRLKEDSRIQFGWSVLTLRAEDGGLRVCEPDFWGDISGMRPTVDTTLAVLKEQVSVLRAAGEDGVDVQFTEFVAVARGAIETADLFLKRDAPLSEGDTGWFVGRLEDLKAARPAAVDALRVFEVLRVRPALVHVMALPPGYLVIVRGNKVEALLDKQLHLKWGQYPR